MNELMGMERKSLGANEKAKIQSTKEPKCKLNVGPKKSKPNI